MRYLYITGCIVWLCNLVSHIERGTQVKGVRELGRYLGLREMKSPENGERYIMLSYMHCILRLTLLGVLNRDYCDGWDM